MRTFLFLSAGLSALTLAAGPALAEEPAAPTLVAEDPVTLPAVSVLASRTEVAGDQVPATVTVFTAEQIEAMLATDIKDLIRFEPGVSVVSQPARFGAALGTTGRGGNEGFTIRGLGGDRVLMVVDGVRSPDGFIFGAQSVGRGGYADLDLMKLVEILRGPASALYGSDGVAGAVAFTTKDPADFLDDGRDFGARARMGYTSADEGWTEGLAVAGRSGALSGLLAYTRRDNQETETNGDRDVIGATRTTANPLDAQSNAVLAKLVWDVNPDHRLRLTLDHYDSQMDFDVLSGRVPASPPFSPNAVLKLTGHDETTRDRVGLDWRGRNVLGLDETRAAAYWQQSDTRQFTYEDRDPAVDRTRDNQFNNGLIGGSIEGRKLIASGIVEHRLVFGGDWSRTTQEGIRDGTVPPMGETFPTSPFPKTDYTLAGAFIQDEITLMGGALKIIPALRYDAYELSTDDDPLYTGLRADQDDSHLSPKVGVVWWANPTVGLFANWAEGFKAPTPSQVNNGYSNLAFGYVSVPNPELKPETSTSVEIGARVRDAAVMNGVFSGQVVAFQADYKDFISQQDVGGAGTPTDPLIFQFVNFTDVEVQGIEAKGRLNWDNGVSLNIAAAWADGDTTSDGATTSLPSIDPFKFVFGAGYDAPSGRFGGQAVVTWSQAKANADTDGLGCYNAAPAMGCATGDDFALVDLTTYWNVTERVTARAGVFNVFDEKYSWWSDVRGVAATSVAGDAYTQPGRNFGISLALRL